jgi:hypothetical protein
MIDNTRRDVQLAADAMQAKLSGSWMRALRSLDQNLEPGEEVRRLAAGVRNVGFPRTLWILTDHKVLVVAEGRVFKSQESIPIDLITAVAAKKSILLAEIMITGAQSTDVLCKVKKADADAFVADLRSMLTGRAKGTLAASSPAISSIADELGRLAGLRSQGVLTEAEFQSQKAKLLA